MAKVYVSSTIVDLKQERQVVQDWLREARHQAVDSYLPDSETVRDSCLADVGTCDLYVLILGYRYGFQPPDSNPEGLSITHLEFRQAKESRVPRIALLSTGIPDVKLSDMADPQRLELVSKFREEVVREARSAEFNNVQGLIQGLSTGIQHELDKQSAGQRDAARVVRLAPRPPLLAGRDELIAELDRRLGAGDGSRPQVAALYGLAGRGTTAVAVEYAHRHLSEVGVAWQFPAEDPAVLATGFGELAALLGAQDMAGDAVAWVHGALTTYRAGWMLVFDNAPSPDAVQRFLPSSGAGRVLITSHNSLWSPAHAVKVPVLDTSVAAGFLVDRTGDPDTQAATKLAGELGGLPLALEQACAYILATGNSLAGYLASFQKRRTHMLGQEVTAKHSEIVAATYALALTQIEQSAPGAAALLRLLAFCAAEPIPLRFVLPRPGLIAKLASEVAQVLAPLLEDEQAAEDAVAALRRYSLVTSAADGSVSVHRLVQAVAADDMAPELAQAWRKAAVVTIDAALPADPQQPGTWPVFAALLPHAQAALAADSNGMERVASYLGNSGCHVAARELWRGILEERARTLGPEPPATLLARAEVAYYTGQAGDAAGARDQYGALLPVCERILGTEDPDTVTVKGKLAYWTEQAKRGPGRELAPATS
jgi:hypothetical protein